MESDVSDKDRERLKELAEKLFAHRGYDGNDIEQDDEPAVSIGEDGIWVASWVHIPWDQIPEKLACKYRPEAI